MIPIFNLHKRLLTYALITNEFPYQYAETIWYLIQLSELPIEIRYTKEGYIRCDLVTYGPTGRRSHIRDPYELRPQNSKEEEIVKKYIQMILNSCK